MLVQAASSAVRSSKRWFVWLVCCGMCGFSVAQLRQVAMRHHSYEDRAHKVLKLVL